MKSLSVRAKIISISTVIMLFALSLNSFYSGNFFAAEYSKALQSKSLNVGQVLTQRLGVLLGLGIDINGIVGFEKQCKDVVENYEEISYAMVVDLDGKIIFHNDPSQHGKTLTNHEVLMVIKTENSTTRQHPIEGEKFYGSFVPVFGKHKDHIATIMIGVPVSFIEEKMQNMFMNSLMVTILFLVIGILLLITTLSMWVTKPLGKLVDVIREIGKKGKLSKKVRINSDDEIGQLASAFNQMIDDLKGSRIKLEEYSRSLKKRVAERTNELNQKVEEVTKTKTAIMNMMEDTDEANKQLIKTQHELKESLRELGEMDIKKDQFISIAAHELKTPLTSIHGFSQLLQDRKIANKFTRRNRYLKIMEHETKRLAGLVSNILDLSRVDLGTVKLSPEPVDINELMEDLKKEMSIPVEEKGLESKYETEKELPKILTDRERVTEILINLINNALKYTPKGKITVKVSREKKNLHFMVKDTGIGISKENQEKIFERFYQVDSSYTRKAGGTGLGLSLCKEFLKILGGEIWVKSELKKGSEFHFTLPIRGVSKEHLREEEAKAKESLKKAEEVIKSVETLSGK